jgi:hypothetical protein
VQAGVAFGATGLSGASTPSGVNTTVGAAAQAVINVARSRLPPAMVSEKVRKYECMFFPLSSLPMNGSRVILFAVYCCEYRSSATQQIIGGKKTYTSGSRLVNRERLQLGLHEKTPAGF